MRPPISERKLVVLIGAGQLINTLDFTMVLPLGPDFAQALDIPVSKLGMLGGSYTAAAAVTGIAGAFFLDRFDRRRALAVALTGLVVATATCGLATGFSRFARRGLLAEGRIRRCAHAASEGVADRDVHERQRDGERRDVLDAGERTVRMLGQELRADHRAGRLADVLH